MVEQSPETARASSIVGFRLNGRPFAFLLSQVAEILPMLAIGTGMPEWPKWLRGMINLRGQTVPVVDLRLRLGMPPREKEPDLNAAVIVARPSERGPVGFIVDAVTAVVDVDEASVENVDELGGDDHPVLGITRSDEELTIILDVDRLLTSEQALAFLESYS